MSPQPFPWPALDSIPEPEPVPATGLPQPHPFDAPSRWTVWMLLVAVSAILGCIAVGWWQIGLGLSVGTLVALAVGRMAGRHVWTRARSRVFDVTALLSLAVAITVVALILPAD